MLLGSLLLEGLSGCIVSMISLLIWWWFFPPVKLKYQRWYHIADSFFVFSLSNMTKLNVAWFTSTRRYANHDLYEIIILSIWWYNWSFSSVKYQRWYHIADNFFVFSLSNMTKQNVAWFTSTRRYTNLYFHRTECLPYCYIKLLTKR
jgi:hypothetical protein